MQSVMFYQGQPCNHGHDGTRYVRSKACVECAKAHGRRWRGGPGQKEYHRRYHQNKTAEQKDREKKYHAEWSKTENGKAKRIGYYFKRNYGITSEGFAAMVAAQGNACAICTKNGTAERHGRLSVDHNHQTDKVRALLCDDCNVGLGQFHDNPERLEAAAQYLKKHGGVDG